MSLIQTGIQISWSELKSAITNRKLLYNKVTGLKGDFLVYAFDGVTLFAELDSITDRADYTTNYAGSEATGATSGNLAVVTASGEQLVKSAFPTPPLGTTGVDTGVTSTASKSGGTSNFDYVIPSGKLLTLQQFVFTGAVNKNGSDKSLIAKCLLSWRPNGTATGEGIITTLYLQGQSFTEVNFNDLTSFSGSNFLGNGTAAFRMRVTNRSKEPIDFTDALRGHYPT